MNVNFNVEFESSDQSFNVELGEVVEVEKQDKDNQVISDGGTAFGKGNFVGLKGYYYSAIDFAAKTITLSTSQTKAAAPARVEWAVGDKVSIVNDSKYDLCSTITAINGNVITVDALPFTKLYIVLPDWDDYCIFVPDKPEAGVVDLGRYATAIGEGNAASARAATAIGRDNIVQSMYGVALGRSNVVKAYAGVATGVKNTIEAEALYGSADGVENTVTAPIAHAGGSNSRATKTGADADGYKCIADAEWAKAFNYMTKALALYAVAMNEETSAEAKGSLAAGKGTKTVLPYSAWFGKYNAPTANHLFGIGMGTSDTNRKNAFVVRKDGGADNCGYRLRHVADAVDWDDAVSLRQVTNLLAELKTEIAKLKDELAN